jgi:hypothetical protein
MMGDEDLWLEGDPFNNPEWQEAERRVRDRDCGIRYFAEGWVTCPLWWFDGVLAVARSPKQMAIGLLLYRHIQADRFVPISNRMFEARGITRKRKYRALALLEDAGLIEVERSNGRTLRARLVLPAEG